MIQDGNKGCENILGEQCGLNINNLQIGFELLRFESLCHFELTKQLVEIFSLEKPSLKYGDEEGINTFLAIGYQLDAAVYLYESFKHMSIIVPGSAYDFINSTEFDELKVVRNNIHTYFKKGKFDIKADKITERNLEEYNLKQADVFYSLRNDISLAFEIVDNARYLIGSDYFIQHCLYESSNKKWSHDDYVNFSSFLSSNIKGIASTVDETEYRLSKLAVDVTALQIELFDYKSANLYAGSNVSESTAFRLMLMLFQLSYGILLIEKVLLKESIISDDLWVCFFTKLLAIKYDESFDNLLSLLKYATVEDKEKISISCSEVNLSANNLLARDFARNLRNTIHY